MTILLTPPAPPSSGALPSSDEALEFDRIVAALTRRGLLAGGLGAALIGLGACSNDQPAASTSTPSSGWSFTDDRGTTVTLDQRPERIAFLTDTVGAALWAAGLRPVAATDSDQGIVSAVGMSMQGVVQIYDADKGVKLETLASAQPDLLIDAVQADGQLQVASTLKQVENIAPVLGLSMYQPVEKIADTADRLTQAVGTSLTDTQARADFEAASMALKTAINGNPELRVAFVFDIDAHTLGVMNPKTWSVLKTVEGLGMHLVPVPAGKDNTYSQAINWESISTIPADLFVWAVSDPLPHDKVWATVPAVAAGQVWRPELASWYAYSWQNFTVLLQGLAEKVSAAKAGVGPR